MELVPKGGGENSSLGYQRLPVIVLRMKDAWLFCLAFVCYGGHLISAILKYKDPEVYRVHLFICWPYIYPMSSQSVFGVITGSLSTAKGVI